MHLRTRKKFDTRKPSLGRLGERIQPLIRRSLVTGACESARVSKCNTGCGLRRTRRGKARKLRVRRTRTANQGADSKTTGQLANPRLFQHSYHSDSRELPTHLVDAMMACSAVAVMEEAILTAVRSLAAEKCQKNLSSACSCAQTASKIVEVVS